MHPTHALGTALQRARTFLLMTVFVIGSLPITAIPLAAQDGAIHLTILHINDVHAQNVPMSVTKTRQNGEKYQTRVGGYAVIKGYVDSLKKLEPNTIFLHAGDDFQGTPISSITKGASQYQILNLVHPDAMTIGNHEFDYSAKNLRTLISTVNFPIVSANLFDKDAGKTFVPQTVLLHVGALTVGVFGLAPPDLSTLTYRENVRGLEVLDPAATARQMVRQLREKDHADIVVALSHMGVENDTALARAVAGIDVIVGGHSHTALFKPIRIDHTTIVQAGAKGRWIGKLDLTIDAKTRRVEKSWGELIETFADRITPNAEVQAKVAELESRVDAGLNEVIGTLETDWKRSGGARESNVGNWMADAMRTLAGTDIAFQNSGGIRKDLAAGPIRLRDMWEIAPFGNEFVTFSMTGAQLLHAMEHQGKKSREFCQVSGLRYSYDESKPESDRLSVTVGGKPVDPARVYTAVTNNYVGSHLWDFFELPEKDTPVTPLAPPVLDRDVFIDAVRTQKTIRSTTDGRIDIRRTKSSGEQE